MQFCKSSFTVFCCKLSAHKFTIFSFVVANYHSISLSSAHHLSVSTAATHRWHINLFDSNGSCDHFVPFFSGLEWIIHPEHGVICCFKSNSYDDSHRDHVLFQVWNRSSILILVTWHVAVLIWKQRQWWFCLHFFQVWSSYPEQLWLLDWGVRSNLISLPSLFFLWIWSPMCFDVFLVWSRSSQTVMTGLWDQSRQHCHLPVHE